MDKLKQDGLITGTIMGKSGNPNWKKGVSGNPKGRPSGTSIKHLIDALKRYGDKQGEDFWDMVVKRAWTNPQVLIAILKKMLPDKTKEEGFTPGNYIIVRNTAITTRQKKGVDVPAR